MVTNDFVTTTDIAHIAKVSVQAVTNWKKRYENFPKAVVEYRRTAVYNRNEIEQWMLDNNLPDEDRTL